MSKLIYAPEDGEQREWEFDPTKLMSVEAEAIEEVGGTQWDTYGAFLDKLNRGGAKAWRAALWIMLRRENPTLQFSHLVIRANEMIFIDDEEAPEVGKDEPSDTPTDSPSLEQGSEPSPNNPAGT